MTNDEKLPLLLDAWKTCVETQQHFNEMLMKVRNFGFVLLAAVLSASGLSFKAGYEFHGVPIASAIIFCGLLFWIVIYFLETKWYSPLLYGSVETGMNLERKISEIDQDFESMKMGEQIKDFSANIYLFDFRGRKNSSSLARGTNNRAWFKLRSERRANLFHLCFISILLLLTLASFFSSVENLDKNLKEQLPTKSSFSLEDFILLTKWELQKEVYERENQSQFVLKLNTQENSKDGSLDGSQSK